MTDRFTVNQLGNFEIYVPADGIEERGKNGQIKGVTCCGRTVELRGQELNRGSAIDFLRKKIKAYNASHGDNPLTLPEKGWVFGLIGGTSAEDLQEIFEALYPPAIISDIEDIPADIVPETALSLIERAKHHEDLGQHAQAISLYEESLELKKKNQRSDTVYQKLGEAYQEGRGVEKNLEKALEYFKEMLSHPQINPLPFVRLKMGEIYEEMGSNIDMLEQYICSYNYMDQVEETKWCCVRSHERIQEKFSLEEIYNIINTRRDLTDQEIIILSYTAKFGHVESQYHMGCHYFEKYQEYPHAAPGGNNLTRAKEYITQAAEQGHANAAIMLEELNSIVR